MDAQGYQVIQSQGKDTPGEVCYMSEKSLWEMSGETWTSTMKLRDIHVKDAYEPEDDEQSKNGPNHELDDD